MTDNLCGCIACSEMRITVGRATDPDAFMFPGPGLPGWRYACEICGNKRCPHHSNHELACTRSNEPGQPGSIFQ